MTIGSSEPLWQVVVGDKEPWRRGRLFLILFALASALTDLLVSGLLVLGGYLTALLVFAAVRSLFWLQYYLIWIGVHWVRWLQGGLSLLYGFAFFVWSFENQSGPMMLWGMFSMATGAYLGFAPSVHFFARHQKENRQGLEVFVVAAVFGVLLASLTGGVLGLFCLQAYLRDEAREFADTAFQRIFAEHDTYFLLEHASGRLLAQPNGRFKLTSFLQNATLRAGDVHDIQKADGEALLRFTFPATFVTEGEMRTQGIGSRGRIMLRLRLGGLPGDWRIDDISWIFPDTLQNRQPSQ